MRKRSTKEILELSSLQARSFSENIEDEQISQQNILDREPNIYQLCNGRRRHCIFGIVNTLQ